MKREWLVPSESEQDVNVSAEREKEVESNEVPER